MRIAILLYDGMTALDTIGPAQVWSLLPGVQLQYLAKVAGPVVTDCGIALTAAHDFVTAWADPDVLFVGGGGRPTLDAAQDEATLTFVRSRGVSAQWVVSVCTGALIVGAAGLLQRYRAATHWSARDLLPHYGATPSTERVCIDRNRASGGGVTAGIDLALTLAAQWAGDEMAKVAELVLEYAPAPPFGTGRPELADPATLALATAMLTRGYGEAATG